MTTEIICQRLARQPDPLDFFAAHTDEGRETGTALLESADTGHGGTRRSLAVVASALRLELKGQSLKIHALSANGRAALARLGAGGDTLACEVADSGKQVDEDARLRGPSVLDPLRDLLARLAPARPADRARLSLVAAFAFELAARFEGSAGDSEADLVAFVPELLLDIDHVHGGAELVAVAFDERARNDLAARLRLLGDSVAAFEPTPAEHAPTQEECPDEEFMTRVLQAQEAIVAGEVFQVVVARGWTLPCPAPLSAYARLRRHNPSPYLFYLRDTGSTLFGASPESALRFDAASRALDIYPVAGTRRRGQDEDEDARIEAELRLDPKELAEHMMLVDLARNDVARVCEPGSRSVPVLLGVDRYRHVMHLVSRVQGRLAGDLDALHALQACLNMGTLTGAPKSRAQELIPRLEGGRRGFYGGAVGIVDGAGGLDTAITIRAAEVREGIARVCAGAGIVISSVPQAEADETRAKAEAVLRAIRGEAA